MAFIRRPQLNKIPGGGMPLAKKESYAKDLTKLTHLELLEIRDRERKLLQNKSKLERLPDKGKRIQDFYHKLLQEIERRVNIDEAAKMFSNLNIASNGETALNDLEWKGNLDHFHKTVDPIENVLDSDDENEIDPLKIIADRKMHERVIKLQPGEVKLITEEDLKEIESFKLDSLDSNVCTEESENSDNKYVNSIDAETTYKDVEKELKSIKPKVKTLHNELPVKEESKISSCSHVLELEPRVHYIVDKTEIQVKEPVREKFKPFRTTVSNVHDPVKEKLRKQGIHWEITAATPPPIQHSGTKLLSLMDSVEIQAQYLFKLKELQEKQAAERLAAKIERLKEYTISIPSPEELKKRTSFTQYRNIDTSYIESEQRFNEYDEVHDPLDEEKKIGSVSYTVYK